MVSPPIAALVVLLASSGTAHAPPRHPGRLAVPDTSRTRTVRVPLDHASPQSRSGLLTVDLGAPFDPAKPTVLVVADGQQFFVQPGTMAELQARVFGDSFNVAGIVPRGLTPAFQQATQGGDGATDWRKAWRVFNSAQWIEDIDQVRRSLVGEHGRILLYGRSGGAYLVHEYLMKHGDHVRRAFTQAPVCPVLNRTLGIPYDLWWRSLPVHHPRVQSLLLDVLAKHPEERLRLLVTLQRLHFFVPADSFEVAVEQLVRAVAAGDTAAYARARARYQTEAVLDLHRAPQGIAMHVRELELLEPAGGFEPRPKDVIAPLLETQETLGAPLLALVRDGAIPHPSFDLAPAHRLGTEILIVTGRYDEAVDYRTSIALAESYPHHHLFLANDNHTLAGMNESGDLTRMIRSFLRDGLASPTFAGALAEARRWRWSATEP